ncbi:MULTISPECIES: DUF2946 family protein [Methylosinus]|uniref:DUF2946 domain-containing protein n=1 Tax=Methylosinus trichosporium (strain ATCC 35070 / NCIMB 11131 / UNIQEM 75 / OB3b) TaxID=595536 RepID=A0A2D2CWB1_METT3|nr:MULTISPECIES: DUF2946 family protein [Methylosinus]ATQ67010.1 hypothetical protein CQW49_03260 [Methylosinus trichosporium OB3b]OBS54516.1 hypothetical protein A8B73_00125 [Methylosinus sp. 3S-1]
MMSGLTGMDAEGRGIARASRFSACVAALSFLVQILAFVLSPDGRVAFASGAAGAALAMSGEFCRAEDGHGGGRPERPSAHHHCAFCPISHSDPALDGVVPGPALPAPRTAPEESAEARVAEPPARPPTGWTSSWSSRAPPRLS